MDFIFWGLNSEQATCKAVLLLLSVMLISAPAFKISSNDSNEVSSKAAIWREVSPCRFGRLTSALCSTKDCMDAKSSDSVANSSGVTNDLSGPLGLAPD